jgi:ubiquitin-protein ligase
MNKRVINQIKRITLDTDLFTIVNATESEIIVAFEGPEGTPYEEGIFYLRFEIPMGYPIQPPIAQFLTKIAHPNVDKNGFFKIITDDWSPANTIFGLLLTIYSLLSDPLTQQQCIFPAKKRNLYINHRDQWNKIAAQWTRKYAKQSVQQTKQQASKNLQLQTWMDPIAIAMSSTESFGGGVVVSEITMEDEFQRHVYEKDSSLQNPPIKLLKRINQEIQRVEQELSSLQGAYIKVVVDPSNILLWKFVLVPAENSPYYGGVFEFHMLIPSDFPNSPPKVIFMTTVGGSVRFNPNLYNEGKVCLSVLGTWGANTWTPESSIWEVLFSILTAILGVDCPIKNEPLYNELKSNSPVCKYYTMYYRIQTLKSAIFSHLTGESGLSPEFKEWVKNYILSQWPAIREQLSVHVGDTIPEQHASYLQITDRQWWASVLENGYGKSLKELIENTDREVRLLSIDRLISIEKRLQTTQAQAQLNQYLSYHGLPIQGTLQQKRGKAIQSRKHNVVTYLGGGGGGGGGGAWTNGSTSFSSGAPPARGGQHPQRQQPPRSTQHARVGQGGGGGGGGGGSGRGGSGQGGNSGRGGSGQGGGSGRGRSKQQQQQQQQQDGGQYYYQDSQDQQQEPYANLCTDLIDMGFDMGRGMGPVTNYLDCVGLINRYNAEAINKIPRRVGTNHKQDYKNWLLDFTNH